jgi:hypothetical protein
VIDIHHLVGKKFAVILIDACEKPEGEWHVLGGRAKISNGQLFLDTGTGKDFPIPEESYGKIKVVTSDLASMLFDAEFSVALTVGPLPNDVRA